MKRAPATLAMLLLLGACGNQVQTTSGAAYRAARPDAAPRTDVDRAVLDAASVEPALAFPARIGLARIQYGRLVPVPPREADSWLAFAGSHPEYGTYVPISPLVAELAAGSATAAGVDTHDVVNEIRLGAARQHVDAVLIYTVATTREDKASPLSLLDLTIVGAYLVPSAGSGSRAGELADDAAVDAVGKLTAEVETMMARLRASLQEEPAAPAKSPASRRPRNA